MPAAEFSLDAMQAWGVAFGACLVPPCVVTLAGDLGAGKTSLVQAICRGYGVEEPVTSPTFALVHEYAAPRSRVYHLDLYRLDGPHQLATIGWDDVLAANAVVLLEWPERAGGEVPPTATALQLDHVDGTPDVRRVIW
jgi:tRNA threonylcarbamoyladenosine biosynthesis protein TsaE